MTDQTSPQQSLNPELVPMVVLPTYVRVTVIREPRDHCANCRFRRVLYRIGLSTSAGDDQTEARCSPCWGLR